MTYRSVSLAFGLSTLLLGACTIVHEPSHPPPPPPPPPGHQQPPPEPGGTAAPGNPQPAGKRDVSALRKFIAPAPPAEGEDNLFVQVVDGTCVVKIDTEDFGDTAEVKATVAPGEHVVSCAPKDAEVQSHTVTVLEGGQPTTVVFSVKTAVGPRAIPGPPTGRPEIPAQ